jgi:hypothetical protein
MRLPQAVFDENSQGMMQEFVPQCLNRMSEFEGELGGLAPAVKYSITGAVMCSIIVAGSLLEVASAFNKMAEK